MLRDAVREERTCTVVLLNYRKGDREPFANLLHIAPVRYAGQGTPVLFYVGVQAEVPVGSCYDDGAQPHAAIEAPADSALGARAAAAASHAASLTDELLRMQAGSPSASVPLAGEPGALPSTLLLELARIEQSFCLSDPSLPDCPIVHASDGFLKLTGYARDEVVGHNCRFLQGEGTDRAAVAELREAVAAQRPHTTELLNYRKSGEPFMNRVCVAPLRDADGKVVFFVGVQMDVAAAPLGGVPGSVAQRAALTSVKVCVRGLHADSIRRRHALPAAT